MLFCLKKNQNTELSFDPSDHTVDASKFEQRDWTHSEFGRIIMEALELLAIMT